MPVSYLKSFLKLETAAGPLLAMATIMALVVANSPLAGLYQGLLKVPLSVTIGSLVVDKPLLLWVNDGLMALFFLLVGLEVKREILEGELSTPDQLVLPAIAAIGGFVAPALIYALINLGNAEALEGWAIPAATDIAFALGVLALLGSRVPIALKVLLTTIAIFDDVAAVVVIALFYTESLSVASLGFAALGMGVLVAFNYAGVTRMAAFVLVGIFVWVCVLKSGVHATLAGFLIAFTIPLRGPRMLHKLEHDLHPWIAFLILPIFAFANAGVDLGNVNADIVFGSVSLGIIAGLAVGKQFGVFTAVWLGVRTGLVKLPEGVNWLALYGVALLTGIGFTMSLFIGSLAFERGMFDFVSATRVGVLAGSTISGLAGYFVLRRALAPR